jgi:signal transduction histidine kinase
MVGLSVERLLPSYPEREQDGCRLDGTRMPLEVIVTQSTVGGKPRSIIVARDVSERKRAERQRHELAQSEKLRVLGQLASGIAHLVSDTPRDGGGRDEVAQRLLSFMGTPAGADSEQCDLRAIVSEAVQLTSPGWRDATQAEGRPIRLSIESEAQPVIEGSPARLREAISHLIYNAVDALPTGGNIRVRLSADHRHAIIEVTDSGVGMSPDLQERIFEPFFTTKSASKGGSRSGLGLAMVFGIVEHHGGRIEVQSALGEGSTFRIKLPLSSVASRPVRLSA